MTEKEGLSRRQMLHRLTALAGGALSAPVVSAVLAGVTTGASATSGDVLDNDGLSLVSAIIDTIIPETDTPSASVAGVHHFINLMLTDWYTPSERKSILMGLRAIDEQAHAQISGPFIEASATDQLAILETFDKAAYGGGENGHFFRRIKELTTVGYYTSEIGASEELRYEPVPGPYEGCVPFSKIGRTWAL